MGEYHGSTSSQFLRLTRAAADGIRLLAFSVSSQKGGGWRHRGKISFGRFRRPLLGRFQGCPGKAPIKKIYF